MLAVDPLKVYAGLLNIRINAGRRYSRITGGLFLFSSLMFFALGLAGRVEGRSVYLISGVLIALGLTFFATWVRLEVAKALSEFVSNLQRSLEP